MKLTCTIDNESNRYTLTGFYFNIDDQRVDVIELGPIAMMGDTCRFYHEQGCAIFVQHRGRNSTPQRMSFRTYFGAECA